MKAMRHAGRTCNSCWIPIILLLAVAAVPLVSYAAWKSFCTIPTEVSLSQGFIRSVLRRDHSESEMIQHVHEKLSQKLAWHGTGMLGWVYFQDMCQGDACILDYLHMEMIVKHFHICMAARRVGFTTVTTTIDFSKSKVEVDVLPGTMWPWPIPIESTDDEISLEVSRVKERAIDSIEDAVWKMHASVTLKFSRSVDSWRVSVYTPHEELIHKVQVDLFDYRIIEEEMQ